MGTNLYRGRNKISLHKKIIAETELVGRVNPQKKQDDKHQDKAIRQTLTEFSPAPGPHSGPMLKSMASEPLVQEILISTPVDIYGTKEEETPTVRTPS